MNRLIKKTLIFLATASIATLIAIISILWLYSNKLPDYKFLRDGLESKKGAENIKKVIKLSKIAEKLDISMAQLSIAWCLKNKNVSTVILGATTTKQLDENIKAAENVRLLDDKVMNSIEKILKNRPSLEPDML